MQTKEQAAQAKKEEGQGGGSPAGAIGGMLGRFGKKKEEPKPAEGGATKASPDSDTRVTFMTVTNTVLSVVADRVRRRGGGSGGVQAEEVRAGITASRRDRRRDASPVAVSGSGTRQFQSPHSRPAARLPTITRKSLQY